MADRSFLPVRSFRRSLRQKWPQGLARSRTRRRRDARIAARAAARGYSAIQVADHRSSCSRQSGRGVAATRFLTPQYEVQAELMITTDGAWTSRTGPIRSQAC